MKLKRLWDWYVRGHYHCDKCPYCWSEWSFEGDCDAGCYIFGELRDTCRLIEPFRSLVGKMRKKKAEYFYAHEFDGFAEWSEKEEGKREKFNELVGEFLSRYELCWKDKNGEYHPIDKKAYIEFEAWRIRADFEEYANPFEVKKLSQEWQDLIKKTFRRCTDIFKPYFCK